MRLSSSILSLLLCPLLSVPLSLILSPAVFFQLHMKDVGFGAFVGLRLDVTKIVRTDDVKARWSVIPLSPGEYGLPQHDYILLWWPEHDFVFEHSSPCGSGIFAAGPEQAAVRQLCMP